VFDNPINDFSFSLMYWNWASQILEFSLLIFYILGNVFQSRLNLKRKLLVVIEENIKWEDKSLPSAFFLRVDE
jgi:hypothetical protein